MRYRLTGLLLLIIVGFNLYAIITDIVLNKNPEPFYYYLIVAAASVLGFYYLFVKKRPL